MLLRQRRDPGIAGTRAEPPRGATGRGRPAGKRLLAGRYEAGTMSEDGRGQTAYRISEDLESEDAAVAGGLPG